MIKTTQWTVGTCGCKIFYTWDDQTTEQDRTHTWSEIKPCKHHQRPGKPLKDHCEEVAAENHKVGRAIVAVEEATDGEVRAEDVQYEFDKDRVLKVKAPRSKIKKKTELASRLGNDNTILEETDG